MGLSSATHRKPMMSVQNRCETSRFLTLRTMWLMPRGGSALLGVGEASLAMVPSMIVELRSTARLPGTARALYGTWPRIAPRPVELAARLDRGPSYLGVRRIDEPLSARRRSG